MDESGTREKGGHRGGGGRVKVYLQAVTDDQADLLTDAEISRELQELITRSGADIAFDANPSPVPGMKIIIIRGVPSQIEAAVKIICLITADEKTSLSSQAQAFWIQWVEAAFPDLHSRAYFLPPVYFNRVPMTRQAVAGQNRLVLQSVHKQFRTHTTLDKQFRTLLTSSNTYKMSNQESSNLNEPTSVLPVVDSTPIPQPSSVQECDLRDDVAMQRVLFCLQKLSEKTGEILVGISQFYFGQYLGNPCYAPAAAQLPSPVNLPSSFTRNWRQGDFDILIIHRHYGFVVCEVKAVGDNLNELDVPKESIDNNIRKKLKDAMRQLDKAEAMLSHLVSDIAAGLRITKTIAVPNLTTHQVQQAVSEDLQLTQDLCKCLGTTDATNISDLCLCSDQLSEPSTPWDVNTMVLEKLEDWWNHNVSVYEHDSHMTSDLYKILVARFCGPATSVTVPCTSAPRLSVKTLGQAVSATGECYTAVITLFPEQVDLLNRATPRLFVTGPPGTGKTWCCC
ncbi:uncharacterized protein LOC112575255 isoform X1 [Pomacea canaliculata]|uniref:uncharacterized protein LOC112575255 isoform X1 n=1 Tax=Pomacea canaliculata TaxID=400727 RepID=UPI000D72EEEB|nr:uncharacterized protein LOC112575255 isoform X1 [Pomacea canaliculata]XP_025112760.1 uncharacterized protein LOC112575255 isoform X1 [Pomacea canaliculata]XP_025112761.1 uncharacterized protein LOC112575255 isoform X1 [Pomacea canaliculata]